MLKYFFALLVLVGFVGTAYATIVTTPYDINVTSNKFYEPNPNKFQLVMKPGDSQNIAITITNNDSKTHAIDLKMAKDGPRPGRSFVFEPNHLEVKPGKTESSILTVSASQEASTGTTVWHTIIAKSTVFGAKSFGFYLEVSEDISAPFPDMVRRGHPGSMFPENTRFNITEEDAINQVPYQTLAPKIPEEYSFQGIYGEGRQNLIYAKQPVSYDTDEFNFWDNGGLLINFIEPKKFSFDDYLDSLSAGEQQVKINGKNAIASESKLIERSSDNEIYSSSRVTVYQNDYQLRLTSQMPLEQLLQIAESMTVPEDAKENDEKFTESNYRFVEFSYQNKVGEPIRFILEKTARNECNSYTATITDENGNIVWTQKRTSLCVITDISSLRTSQIKLGFDENNLIIPSNSSKYVLRVEIDGGVIEREFTARNTISSISLDRTVYPVDFESKNPLKQFWSGVTFENIQCKEHLQLAQRYDGRPACVNPESVQKLVQREWGTAKNWIKVSNANKAVHYELDSGQLSYVLAFSEYDSPLLPQEKKQTWLQIGVTTDQEDNLKITLPRNLVDSKINGMDDDFFVLLDGVETEYKETKTESERIVSVSLSPNVDILEIVGYGYYNSDLSKFSPEPKVEYDVEPIPLEPTINDDGTISKDEKPYTFYDFHGLKQVYNVGEPISFTETVQGYSNPCVQPHFEILDGNNLEPVWEYKIVYPCPFIKDPIHFKITNIMPNEKVSSPILNKTGPYILRSYHSYSEGYSVATFSVVGDSFVRNTVDPCNVVYDLDANDLSKRTAPPMSISEYGRDATFLESFSLNTSIGKLSLPSYIPSCYEPKSYKIKDDLKTLVYYPKDLQYDDSITITKIIQEGVLFLVSDTKDTASQWSEHVAQSVKDAPDIRSSDVFRGHDILLINGIPSKDMSSTLKVVIDGKLIEIISTKLDTKYLMKVFESMFEN